MKKFITFLIALMGMFAAFQSAWAANVVFNVTVPTPTYQVWMVGSFQGWDNTKMVQMTKVDDTHYTLTLDDATFASGVTKDNMTYKYSSGNGGWNYIEKNADGSELAADRKYADSNGTDVVARWNLVYNPTVLPKPMNVTIDVLTPAGTIECYINGNFNNWAGPTAPADSVRMVKKSTNPDGTIVFEKKIYTPDANLLEYNFCSGPDWSFQQLTPSGNFKYPEVNPVVTAWKLIYDPSKLGTINITANVPSGSDKVWIIGSFEGWSLEKAVQGTKNTDGTYSFTIPLVQAIEYKLYNFPAWSNVEGDGTGKEVANRKAEYPADANINVTVLEWLIPTGIHQVKEATNLIYTRNSSIVVEGVTSQVDVFDLTGRTLQTKKIVGTFTSKSLKSGVYIVRVDGATKKVTVK
ncbi:MAG TPA: T9SS type A sorting domain-containing protein [Prolixibacteraceae bacterium]|jgi:hypothetical protein